MSDPRQLQHANTQQPTRAQRATGWSLVIAAYAACGIAFCWKDDWAPLDGPSLWAWTLLFLVRTLITHIAGVLVLLTVAGTFRHVRGLWLAALPLLLFALATERGGRASVVIPAGAPGFTLLSANLLMINADPAPLADEIDASSADVILLQEYSPRWETALDRRLARKYPHRAAIVREDSFGAAIFSRFAFVEKVQTDLKLGEWELPQFRSIVRIGGQEVVIYNLHLAPPRKGDYIGEHRLEFRDLLAELARERRPTVVSGDFNFTGHTWQADSLLALGFADAHQQAGTGRGATWPVIGLARYLPGIQLDHVFLRGGVACRGLSLGVGQNSDHRPLTATLALVTLDGNNSSPATATPTFPGYR